LEQEAYLSLWRTYDRLKILEEELFADYELTAQQYNALRLLRAAREPMPTLALAERLISRAPDITRMLDKLEQRGLISRTRSTADRRTVLIRITAAGRAGYWINWRSLCVNATRGNWDIFSPSNYAN
jgi:DNA-binding MarR family transcriptional regulator